MPSSRVGLTTRQTWRRMLFWRVSKANSQEFQHWSMFSLIYYSVSTLSVCLWLLWPCQLWFVSASLIFWCQWIMHWIPHDSSASESSRVFVGIYRPVDRWHLLCEVHCTFAKYRWYYLALSLFLTSFLRGPSLHSSGWVITRRDFSGHSQQINAFSGVHIVSTFSVSFVANMAVLWFVSSSLNYGEN